MVRGMRGVGKVCMCLARGRRGGEWKGGLGLGFTNPVGTGECSTCVCGEWVGGLEQGLEEWGGVMSV